MVAESFGKEWARWFGDGRRDFGRLGEAGGFFRACRLGIAEGSLRCDRRMSTKILGPRWDWVRRGSTTFLPIREPQIPDFFFALADAATCLKRRKVSWMHLVSESASRLVAEV